MDEQRVIELFEQFQIARGAFLKAARELGTAGEPPWRDTINASSAAPDKQRKRGYKKRAPKEAATPAAAAESNDASRIGFHTHMEY